MQFLSFAIYSRRRDTGTPQKLYSHATTKKKTRTFQLLLLEMHFTAANCLIYDKIHCDNEPQYYYFPIKHARAGRHRIK